MERCKLFLSSLPVDSFFSARALISDPIESFTDSSHGSSTSQWWHFWHLDQYISGGKSGQQQPVITDNLKRIIQSLKHSYQISRKTSPQNSIKMSSKLMIILVLAAIVGCALAQLVPIAGSRDLTGGYYDHYTGQYSSAITGRVYNTAPAVAVAG